MRSSTRLPHLGWPALLACCLLHSGCLPVADTTSDQDSPSSLQEQAASASQSLGVLMDAASEASLTAVALPSIPSGGGEHAPDLTLLNGIRTFDLATLTLNGQPLFSSVTTSGTITVTHVGSAVTSSPVGSTTLYTGTVSVALAGIVITNGGNGDRLSIPSGTFTYALSSSCTTTDVTNWVLDQRTSVTIDPAFDATVSHAGRSYNLRLSGNRALHQVITREFGSGVDRRTVRRDISGSTDGSPLSTDPLSGAHQYASWRVAVEGVPVTWYRFATVTSVADFTQLPGNITTVSSTEDRTFISVLGVVVGPKTAGQWSSLLGARLQAEFL